MRPRKHRLAARPSIPQGVRDALRARLEQHARNAWADRCREVAVRFRGAFAYVDAFEANPWHPPGTTPEERARIDVIPTRLCRLGYLGSLDRWEYAFYKSSDDAYEPSVVLSGSFEATPEDAFDTSAAVYLR